ncbi:winged helix-turn-helix domain-containing protein [Phenylobacterium zucineum]|nr:winged helix-turn-helix domain-containing protein [Phenylobacterium zucineum]
MNEHTSIRPPREIVLAYEPAFRLAATEVRPAELEVEGPAGVRPLEPRVMKVLVALHRSLGAAVSREALGQQCWGGRIVSEDALTRCVVQLRKALAADPAIVVETIPTVGYRLQADGGAPTRAVRPPRRAALIAAAVAALAVMAALGGAWLWSQRPQAWAASDFRPLTSEPGFKTFPALSPDGRQVAYAHAALPFAPRDIHLRAVAGGEAAAVTSGPDDDFAPAWAPDGDRIAFLRRSPDGGCAVMVAIVPRGGERRLAPCREAGAHPTWLDARTLVVADTPAGGGLPRLSAIDATTGEVRALTAPPPDTLGDNEPQASPDGRQVAFRRTLRFGADEIVVLDVRTGRERTLTRDGWKAAGYVWSPDGRNLLFASNRGGGLGLWRLDARRPAEPEQVSLGLGVVSFLHMSADRTGQAVVEIARPRSGLVRLGPSGAPEARIVTASNDWDPVTGPDGAVAHISDRAGAPDLWISAPGGGATRLTEGLGSYVSSPAWSGDGRSLAFIAVIGRQADIFTVGRDGSRLLRLTDDGRDKRSPVFGPRGRVYYVERRGQAWRLMTVDPAAPGAAPAPVPGGQGWRSVQAAPSGALYGQRQGAETIGRLDGGAWRPAAEVWPYESWAASDDGVFILDTSARPRPALWFQPWSAPRRRLPDPGPMAARVTPSALGGATLGEALTEAVDLGLMRLGPARR